MEAFVSSRLTPGSSLASSPRDLRRHPGGASNGSGSSAVLKPSRSKVPRPGSEVYKALRIDLFVQERGVSES